MATVVSDAWEYGDYVTMEPGRPKLARLRLHVQEVQGRVADGLTSRSVEGSSWTREGLSTYLKMLHDEMADLEGYTGVRDEGGFYRARLGG